MIAYNSRLNNPNIFGKIKIINPVDSEEKSCLKIIGCPNTRDKYCSLPEF